MARVYTIEEIRTQLRVAVTGLRNCQSLLRAARSHRDQLFDWEHHFSDISTLMNTDLDAIELLADSIAADLTAMNFTYANKTYPIAENYVTSYTLLERTGSDPYYTKVSTDSPELTVFDVDDVVEISGCEHEAFNRWFTVAASSGTSPPPASELSLTPSVGTDTTTEYSEEDIIIQLRKR